jgi:Fungal specific transcription factor domain
MILSEVSSAGISFSDLSYSFRPPPVEPLHTPRLQSSQPPEYLFPSFDGQIEHFPTHHRNSADSSALVLRHPSASMGTGTIISNGLLSNSVQSDQQLRHAIHIFSKDFRLRGQPLTVESIVSPLIYRYEPLKQAVLANFAFQTQELRVSVDLSPGPKRDYPQDHYNATMHLLQQSMHDPLHADANVGAMLMLAFYDICRSDNKGWTNRIAEAASLIRLRGTTLAKHPLSLPAKFLFALYIRSAAVGSNAIGEPVLCDPESFREIAKIVYSGVPISDKGFLRHRIELEGLLTEISVFQYDCNQFMSDEREWAESRRQAARGEWTDSQRDTLLRTKYDGLISKYEGFLARLKRWAEVASEYIYFEEAIGHYPRQAFLPYEMGFPLLCVVLAKSSADVERSGVGTTVATTLFCENPPAYNRYKYAVCI